MKMLICLVSAFFLSLSSANAATVYFTAEAVGSSPSTGTGQFGAAFDTDWSLGVPDPDDDAYTFGAGPATPDFGAGITISEGGISEGSPVVRISMEQDVVLVGLPVVADGTYDFLSIAVDTDDTYFAVLFLVDDGLYNELSDVDVLTLGSSITPLGMTYGEAGDWNGDITSYSFELAPVPLPAAAWMLIAGLAGIGGIRYRRKSA